MWSNKWWIIWITRTELPKNKKYEPPDQIETQNTEKRSTTDRRQMLTQEDKIRVDYITIP